MRHQRLALPAAVLVSFLLACALVDPPPPLAFCQTWDGPKLPSGEIALLNGYNVYAVCDEDGDCVFKTDGCTEPCNDGLLALATGRPLTIHFAMRWSGTYTREYGWLTFTPEKGRYYRHTLEALEPLLGWGQWGIGTSGRVACEIVDFGFDPRMVESAASLPKFPVALVARKKECTQPHPVVGREAQIERVTTKVDSYRVLKCVSWVPAAAAD